MECFIAILHLQPQNRFHPCIYRESPLPGSPAHLRRFKSHAHHTAGFETCEAAVEAAHALQRALDQSDHPMYGMIACPPDRVITDPVMITDDPIGVLVLPSFGDGDRSFQEALQSIIRTPETAR